MTQNMTRSITLPINEANGKNTFGVIGQGTKTLEAQLVAVQTMIDEMKAGGGETSFPLLDLMNQGHADDLFRAFPYQMAHQLQREIATLKIMPWKIADVCPSRTFAQPKPTH